MPCFLLSYSFSTYFLLVLSKSYLLILTDQGYFLLNESKSIEGNHLVQFCLLDSVPVVPYYPFYYLTFLSTLAQEAPWDVAFWTWDIDTHKSMVRPPARHVADWFFRAAGGWTALGGLGWGKR